MKKVFLMCLLCLTSLSVAKAQSDAKISDPKLELTPNTDLNEIAKRGYVLQSRLNEAEAGVQLFVIDPKKYAQYAESQFDLTTAYIDGAKDPMMGAFVTGWIWNKYMFSKFYAKSAVQISQAANEAESRMSQFHSTQNAVIISQNQQIIDLLTQLNAKK